LEGNVRSRGKPCPPAVSFKVPPCSGPYPNYEITIYADNDKTKPHVTAKTDPMESLN
jgi:hypothetical protein